MIVISISNLTYISLSIEYNIREKKCQETRFILISPLDSLATNVILSV